MGLGEVRLWKKRKRKSIHRRKEMKAKEQELIDIRNIILKEKGLK
jgi:hypothetical protein